jgi:hypothetical protein
MAGAISQPRQSCQFPFLLDEKSTVVPVGSAGEQSGGAQEVPYGAVRSNSERAAPSACVGKRFCFVQIVWNRSTRRAGARGGFGLAYAREDPAQRISLKDVSSECSTMVLAFPGTSPLSFEAPPLLTSIRLAG